MIKTKDLFILLCSSLLIILTAYSLLEGVDNDCDRFGYLLDHSQTVALEFKKRLISA